MYITPDTIPSELSCRVLEIPNEPIIYAAVSGALQLLTFPENWEQVGAVTVDEIVLSMVGMYEAFLNSDCGIVIGDEVEVAEFTHEEPTNTGGGTYAAATDVTIPYNTTRVGTTWASLSANQLTLQPGRYWLNARHMVRPTANNTFGGMWLQQVAPSSVVYREGDRHNIMPINTTVPMTVSAILILSEPTTFEVRIRCASGGQGSLGSAMNFAGHTEFYGAMVVARIADS